MGAVIVAGTTLAVLLTTCAPDVAPSTMTAIVAVESAGNPYALNDNTSQRSYAPREYANALATAQALILQGHSVDVGIAQVNSNNFAAFHTTAREMLDPCRNLRVASSILVDDYAASHTVFAEPRSALWYAISAYNTGSLYAGKRYVDRVIAAASRVCLVPPIDLLYRHGRKDRSPPHVVSASSKAIRKIRKQPPYDFAFATPNANNLIFSSSSLRRTTNTGAKS